MELKDFVSETIRGIVEGVVVAQQHAGTVGAYVNPATLYASGTWLGRDRPGVLTTKIAGAGAYDHEVQYVEFDVAVTVDEKTEKRGSIGIAKLIDVGASKGSESSTQSASRIKFRVPVVFPHHPGTATQLQGRAHQTPSPSPPGQ